MRLNVHPSNLVSALSVSLELSADGLSKHHWRTALIASRIADHIGLEEGQRQVLVYSALLHDIGAASNWSEKKKLQNFKVAGDVYHHAEAGYELLKDSRKLGMLAETIRYHHDKWDGSSPHGLAGRDIPLTSRIISLADRLEVQLRENVYIFEQCPDVLSAIREWS
ncbi:MAG: HD-GYP domain-containing protein, partial [Sporomusa sp.]